MFGAILKATNSSFQKGMTFCRSIYVKKVMKLLAFIFEQPSYKSVSSQIPCMVYLKPYRSQSLLQIHVHGSLKQLVFTKYISIQNSLNM